MNIRNALSLASMFLMIHAHAMQDKELQVKMAIDFASCMRFRSKDQNFLQFMERRYAYFRSLIEQYRVTKLEHGNESERIYSAQRCLKAARHYTRIAYWPRHAEFEKLYEHAQEGAPLAYAFPFIIATREYMVSENNGIKGYDPLNKSPLMKEMLFAVFSARELLQERAEFRGLCENKAAGDLAKIERALMRLEEADKRWWENARATNVILDELDELQV